MRAFSKAAHNVVWFSYFRLRVPRFPADISVDCSFSVVLFHKANPPLTGLGLDFILITVCLDYIFPTRYISISVSSV